MMGGPGRFGNMLNQETLKPRKLSETLMRLVGYLSCYLTRRKRMLSPETIRFVRQEQLRRLLPFRTAAIVPLGSTGRWRSV